MNSKTHMTFFGTTLFVTVVGLFLSRVIGGVNNEGVSALLMAPFFIVSTVIYFKRGGLFLFGVNLLLLVYTVLLLFSEEIFFGDAGFGFLLLIPYSTIFLIVLPPISALFKMGANYAGGPDDASASHLWLKVMVFFSGLSILTTIGVHLPGVLRYIAILPYVLFGGLPLFLLDGLVSGLFIGNRLFLWSPPTTKGIITIIIFWTILGAIVGGNLQSLSKRYGIRDAVVSMAFYLGGVLFFLAVTHELVVFLYQWLQGLVIS